MSTTSAVPSDCPFCRVNQLLQGKVLAEAPGGFAIEAAFGPGYYLIIPHTHIEALGDLPDDWWHTFKALLATLPVTKDYNLSLNMGQAAGQTVKHLHFWIIPRTVDKPSSGKGLAKLITEADQQA